MADEFAKEIDLAEHAEKVKEEQQKLALKRKASAELSRKVCESTNAKIVVGRPTERNWQECPDRNWAAEFGYGKDGGTLTGKLGGTMGLLSRMKSSFTSADQGSSPTHWRNIEGHGISMFLSLYLILYFLPHFCVI